MAITLPLFSNRFLRASKCSDIVWKTFLYVTLIALSVQGHCSFLREWSKRPTPEVTLLKHLFLKRVRLLLILTLHLKLQSLSRT